MIEILIAPNSFKGSIDSVEASRLFKKYFHEYLPKEKYFFLEKPVSDGGDGFLNVCKANFNLSIQSYEISTPYNEKKFTVDYGFSEKEKTVYIESAKILGIEIIPNEERRPLQLSSKGLGELLHHLKKNKEEGKLLIEKVIIGIGGTGTSDLGLGCAEAFGLKLLDENDNLLKVIPKNFLKTKKIILPEVKFPFQIEAVIDVDNPLLGERGAAKIFAKQKGATGAEINIIEKGFIKILDLSDIGKSKRARLSGAGGGLAAGLKLFLGGKNKYSKKFILEDLGLNKQDIEPEIVITGEGSFDSQSLMDKGASIILKEFDDSKRIIFLCAGVVKDDFKKNIFKNVSFLELKKYFSDEKESINNIEKGISLACKEISEKIN